MGGAVPPWAWLLELQPGALELHLAAAKAQEAASLLVEAAAAVAAGVGRLAPVAEGRGPSWAAHACAQRAAQGLAHFHESVRLRGSEDADEGEGSAAAYGHEGSLGGGGAAESGRTENTGGSGGLDEEGRGSDDNDSDDDDDDYDEEIEEEEVGDGEVAKILETLSLVTISNAG